MRSFVLAAAAGLAAVSAAHADYHAGDLKVVSHYTLDGGPVGGDRATPGAMYSNRDNFLAAAYAPGGAAGGITKLMADDITPGHGVPGVTVTQFTFSVYNANSTAVSVRPRARFWFADGASGGPGTYYNGIGYTFNPISFSSGVTVVTGTVPAGFIMPTSTFWAGITFDNNNGGTGATNAQLSNFGQGLFDPPLVGSSDDVAFETTAAGSFFNTNNPAGSLFNFGGAPIANFGWEFVPTPGAGALLVLGGIAAARRRR